MATWKRRPTEILAATMAASWPAKANTFWSGTVDPRYRAGSLKLFGWIGSTDYDANDATGESLPRRSGCHRGAGIPQVPRS
jgi:hypothetical protein